MAGISPRPGCTKSARPTQIAQCARLPPQSFSVTLVVRPFPTRSSSSPPLWCLRWWSTLSETSTPVPDFLGSAAAWADSLSQLQLASQAYTLDAELPCPAHTSFIDKLNRGRCILLCGNGALHAMLVVHARARMRLVQVLLSQHFLRTHSCSHKSASRSSATQYYDSRLSFSRCSA
jgi:hypothetical protein